MIRTGMRGMNMNALEWSLNSLSVLREAGEGPIFSRSRALLASLRSGDEYAFAQSYGALTAYTLEHGSISEGIMQALHLSANRFARESCAKEYDRLDEALKAAARHDVHCLNEIAGGFRAEWVLREAATRFPSLADELTDLPLFGSGQALPIRDERDLYAFYRQHGYGLFARHTAYTYRGGRLEGIACPDSIRLSDLKGYRSQKEVILRNTKLLLSGESANNILLYGDKGTGKSSTVKAVLNEFSAQGLRLIEFRKEDAGRFYELCTLLSQSPFHFIIFLDDISFESADDRFGALKAMLEGGVLKRPDNAVIYATSNRRHLVAEKFSDRDGDDLHVRDTIESITSLSDRFGIELVFGVPDKDEYLQIVEALAQESGIELEQSQLFLEAERFALLRSGRSPRCARQFISSLLSRQV